VQRSRVEEPQCPFFQPTALIDSRNGSQTGKMNWKSHWLGIGCPPIALHEMELVISIRISVSDKVLLLVDCGSESKQDDPWAAEFTIVPGLSTFLDSRYKKCVLVDCRAESLALSIPLEKG